MAEIISFANQKGGVGKTTSAINIAACLAQRGAKVLLCDFDPQGNATTGVGIKKKQVTLSSYNMISESVPASSVTVKAKIPGLSVIPSSIDLAGADLILANEQRREFKLYDLLDNAEEFDYVFIDCPPSLGLLTLNALCASDHVIIPMQCEYFALEGLSQLTLTLQRVKKLYKPSLDLLGILLTMFDGRLNLSVQVAREISRHFPGKAFTVTVPRSVRVSEAPSHGEPVVLYDPSCKASHAYKEVTEELCRRLGQAAIPAKAGRS